MRTGSFVVLAFSLGLTAAFVGCGGDATPAPETPKADVSATPPPPASAEPKAEEAPKKEEPKKEEPKKEEAKKTAKDVIVPGATFMLSFDDSPEYKKAHSEKCDKQKKDDAKKKCLDEAHATAAKRGIKFEKDDKGIVFVHFGADAKGKDVELNKLTLKDAKEDGANKFTGAFHGKDSGKEPMKLKDGDKVTFEVPDETTVVVAHPKDGKLVFKKK